MLFLRKTVLNIVHKIMPCENCENEMQVTFWASALSMGRAQKSLKAQQTSAAHGFGVAWYV